MPKYNPNPLFPNEPLFEIHDFSELPKSPRYTLYCNGQEQTVYHTDSFDYAIVVRRDDAPVSVEVCVSDSFKKAVLRPQSLEIPFDREENHIRFSLPYKAKVSLELDNDLKRPLLILSSCYVAPRSKGETYYFRKGQIYNVGNLELKSGESAYLEEGCVVCGRIYSNMADNVRVSGNGILYGGVWHKPDENGGRLMASFYLGKHILVEGISVVDNGVWNVVPGACRDVIIRDVNIMSRLVTGDGIDIVGCEEVLVEDCFIRACDDCVCIKACALPGPAACCNVRDIKVRRCVLWNAEPGNALEIGYELLLDKAEQKFAETPVKAKKLSDLSKQYIAEHYHEDISLQTISESLFISPQHLSSVFKRETGQGLANYLRAYRMKCAKELLKGTRKKVSVICKEVGYPNETYFCKIFRDLYGMSPQQYRDEGTNGKEQL